MKNDNTCHPNYAVNAMLNLVLKDNPGKWEATPGNLLPIMVNTIKELKAENDGLKEKNEMLEAENLKINSRLEQIETLLGVKAEK